MGSINMEPAGSPAGLEHLWNSRMTENEGDRYGLAQPLQRVSPLAGTRECELAKQVLSQLSYTPSDSTS